MAYRTTKILSMAPKTSIPGRVSPSRAGTSVSEISTLEMGTSFRKGDSCDAWEPIRLPYLRSQNSELSACLPTLPERAYVSGWVPFPQSLPPCQTLDVVRSPIISHSTGDLCGVDVVLGKSDNIEHPRKGVQAPLSPQLLINFDEEYHEQPSPLPEPCFDLGLSLIDMYVDTDDVIAQVKPEAQETPLKSEITLMDSTSGTKLSNHVSLKPVPVPLQLPSPLPTPKLPTLVLTSAPFKRIPDVKPQQSEQISQLNSPPVTPTLLLTAPSIHCGLGFDVEGGMIDRDVDEELENWSDVFGFQEYEDDEELLDRASRSLLDEFPSPPERLARRSILDVPRFVTSDGDAHSDSSVPAENVTALHATDCQHITSKDKDKVEEAPFDYAAFRERLANFLEDVNSQKTVHTVAGEDVDKSPLVTIGNLPTSSSSPQFDYGKLRARRRSHTLLSDKPARRDVSAGVGSRPLPLPAEFPPLLCRVVDRSRRQVSP